MFGIQDSCLKYHIYCSFVTINQGYAMNHKTLCSCSVRVVSQITQECIPVGCVPPACCPCLPTRTAPCSGGGGIPAWGVYLPRGYTCRGVYLPMYSPPHVNRMTDRCKNIILPQTSFAGGKNMSIWFCNNSTGGSKISQMGMPTPKMGTPTYYFGQFSPRPASK